MTRALVAGWIGSTNLGDELVFSGLRRLCSDAGVEVVAVSRRPEATRRMHEVRGVRGVVGMQRAISAADAMILGGGGLLQDETSPFNLPFHLGRVAAGRARKLPWAAIGLGVGPLETRIGHRLVRGMRTAQAISVRDPHSARVLHRHGVEDAIVAADLAFHLPPPEVEVDDVVCVSLRPWTGSGGHLLPVGWRRNATDAPSWFLDSLAGQLDAVASSSGLAIRFVAMQTDRDHTLHKQVAERMTSEVELRQPGLDEVIAEIGRGRVVVAMRYHAAICAVLTGRPSVTIAYSPKVDSLTAELGPAGRRLAWHPGSIPDLPDAVAQMAEQHDAVAAARDRLVTRADGNRVALDQLLEAVG